LLAINSITVFGLNAADFAIVNDSGETSLAPSTSRTLNVEFNPQTAGMKQAGIRILTDDLDQAQVDIPLQASGLNPQVSVMPMTNLDLGEVSIDAGSSSPMAVAITNSGTSELSITGVSITGANAAEFMVVADTGETVLAPNESRTLNMAFDPIEIGQRTANLHVTTDDFDNTTISLTLTGEGIVGGAVPDISVTPNSVDYEELRDVNNKVTMIKTITITNSGAGNLEITSLELTGSNNDAFIITADSGESVLTPSATRTIELSYSPDEAGEHSAPVIQ
ncbi:MAG: hypothetical protein AMJ55_12490, partial [Gammaproteobacteria bacterium SG8_15]